jgi:hypothetical protein
MATPSASCPLPTRVNDSASSVLRERETDCRQCFISFFMECLDVEYRFLEDVAAGHHEARIQERDQYLNLLLSAVSMSSGTIASAVPGGGAAGFIIDAFVHMAKKRIQDDANDKSSGQLARLVPMSRTQRESVFHLIGTEMWYRYGPAVMNFIFKPHFQGNMDTLLKGVTRIGAIRVLFFAMSNGIRLISMNVPTLCDGIFAAFDSFPEKTKLQQLLRGDILFGNRKLSVQGLYTETGLLEPGLCYWIRGDSLNNADLFPYGFMNVPAGYLRNGSFVRYHNQRQDLEATFSAKLCLGFRHRYVSFDHIVEYLVAVKGSAGAGPPFGSWLCGHQVFMQEFHCRDGAEFVPIYRGRLDGAVLALRGGDFSDGNFEGVDFSFCTITKVVIKGMRHCNIHGSEISECTVVGGAMNNTMFSMCRIAQCSFQHTRGVMSFKFCSMSKCNFGEARLHLSWDDNTIDPDTRNSFETAKADKEGASGPANPQADPSLYTYLVNMEKFMQKQEADERMRERERFERQKSDATMQDVLNTLEEMKAKSTIEKNNSSKTKSWEKDELESMIFRIAKRTFIDEIEQFKMLDKNVLPESINRLYADRIDPNEASGDIARQTVLKVLDVLFFRRPVEMLEQLCKVDVLQLFRDLPKYSIISTSGDHGPDGQDGIDGRDGMHGGGSGGDGTQGQAGQIGTPAKPNTVSLLSVPDQDVFIVNPKDESSNPYIMRLRDGNISVNLYALVSVSNYLCNLCEFYFSGGTRREGR